jgi:hypothetical protein
MEIPGFLAGLDENPLGSYNTSMKGNRRNFLPLAGIFLSVWVYAQEATSSPSLESLFTPFVSRLEGEIKNNLLRLSWRDSPDVKGPLYIYVSDAPLREDVDLSFMDRPVEVPYGAESYIYEIDAPGTYYYFVVASDEAGRRYELLIPFSNTISIIIEYSDEGLAVSAGVPGQGEIPPGISGLRAFAEGDRIIITFGASDLSKNQVLYRGVKPFDTISDFAGAVIVQSGIGSPFTDYPVPGIPYYSAVIPEEELVMGAMGIYPGENTTIEPVEAGGAGIGLSASLMRAFPLPAISLAAAIPGLDTGGGVPRPDALTTEAAGLLGNINRPVERPVPMTPRAFGRDLDEQSGGGEDYSLRSIMKDSFAKRDWERCRDELQRFLSLPRSAGAEARARFYLGECYYFLNMPRESLFEFLSARDEYPEESAEWINAVLAALTAD